LPRAGFIKPHPHP